MKKQFFFAMLSAIALSGAALFTGCSSTDDVATEDINPTYDPTTNTVKANFSLALTNQIGGSDRAKTRMGDMETQASSNFRGMKNIYLIPFDTPEDISTSKTRAGDNVLDNQTIASTETSKNATSGTYNYHYLDVVVPIGTMKLLFYGFSNDAEVASGGTVSSETNAFQYGAIDTGTANFTTGNPSDFHFDLVKIHNSTTEDAQCTKLIEYLTKIAATYTGTAETPSYWGNSSNAGIKSLYDLFVSQKAGSAENIRKVVSDLYKRVYANADDMSKAIVASILTEATEDVDATTNAKLGTITFSTNINAANNTYPRNIYLPDGAAVISWTTAAVPAVPSAYTTGDRQKAVSSLDKYVYPPALTYFASSPIKVSNSKLDAKYTSLTNWSDILGQYSADNTVLASTRDIALVNEIQYGVGRMALTVKASNARMGTNNTTNGGQDYSTQNVLLDRKGNEVPIPVEGFPVTGVLIGTQRNTYFNFMPVTPVYEGTAITNEFTVYDNSMPTGMKAELASSSTTPTTNNTLVIESDPNAIVYIALELENTSGIAFEGIEGIVYPGAKFYMAAELNPSPTTPSGTYSVIQPSGEETINKVFLQDYVTNVNLTIGVNSTNLGDAENPNYPSGLGAAYNTIPDLGTPSLRLGFSVDLSWSQGLKFDIEM